MFDFGDNPSDAEVFRKAADLIEKNWPAAGHWKELVVELLRSRAEDLENGHLTVRGAEEPNEAERVSFRAEMRVNLDNVPPIAGWKPPIIYDITTDNYRLATQKDIDLGCTVANEWGSLMRDIEQHRENLKHNVTDINEKHGEVK